MVHSHTWSPISYRSSVGQGKFAGQRPAFYHYATQPTRVQRRHAGSICMTRDLDLWPFDLLWRSEVCALPSAVLYGLLLTGSGVSTGAWGTILPEIWTCSQFGTTFHALGLYHNMLYTTGLQLLHKSCNLTTVKLLLICTSSLYPHIYVGPK